MEFNFRTGGTYCATFIAKSETAGTPVIVPVLSDFHLSSNWSYSAVMAKAAVPFCASSRFMLMFCV